MCAVAHESSEHQQKCHIWRGRSMCSAQVLKIALTLALYLKTMESCSIHHEYFWINLSNHLWYLLHTQSGHSRSVPSDPGPLCLWGRLHSFYQTPRECSLFCNSRQPLNCFETSWSERYVIALTIFMFLRACSALVLIRSAAIISISRVPHQ